MLLWHGCFQSSQKMKYKKLRGNPTTGPIQASESLPNFDVSGILSVPPESDEVPTRSLCPATSVYAPDLRLFGA